MAFTFEVFPTRAAEIELDVLASRVGDLLRHYVSELPIARIAPLSSSLAEEARQQLARRAGLVSLRLGSTASEPAPARLGAERPVRPEALAFSVTPGTGGGVLQRLAFGKGQSRQSWWSRELAPRLQARGLVASLERARELGFHFEVMRTIGQPALAALAHGFIAAAIAELTEGILYSPDGAWDEDSGPYTAPEFLASFMRPVSGISERHRMDAEDRQRALISGLGAFDEDFLGRVRTDIVDELVERLGARRGDPEAERSAFEHALRRMDTARVLSEAAPTDDLRHLVGVHRSGEGHPGTGALERLQPTPAEYDRWRAQLGELLA